MKVDPPAAIMLDAVMPDAASARKAIEALQFDGVDASQITLRSVSGDVRASDVGSADRPILWRVFWTGFWWSIVGAIVGAAVGYLFAVFDIGLPGTPNNTLIQVASWAMFIHIAGALWGCYAAMTSGEAWALTFQAGASGPVPMRVRATNERTAARAERTLRNRGATQVDRVTKRSEPVSAPDGA